MQIPYIITTEKMRWNKKIGASLGSEVIFSLGSPVVSGSNHCILFFWGLKLYFYFMVYMQILYVGKNYLGMYIWIK